jgi:bifunctional NMN adenylyltransferase/nudix hydrolase
MSQRQFDYLVFIGRFQPFHVGHWEVLDRALGLADKVIVLVGSSNQPRTIKNPFTFDERKKMIQNAFRQENDRIVVEPLSDNKYNDTAWAASVQSIVSSHVTSMGWSDKPRRGGIIGHVKDDSSYYLNLFPQWELIDHAINEEVHATDIR